MNFPQFWARGRSEGFFAWKWSFRSQAEAQLLANQAAQQLSERFKAGDLRHNHGEYYSDRPFREQVLHEIKSETGEASAVITRNSYGCEVFNTAKVMFVDVDLPRGKRSGGFFKMLFAKPGGKPSPATENQVLEKVELWTRSNSHWGWRVYRTRSGMRLLATQDLVAADSEIVNEVFEVFGADQLYRRLCTTQKCFRARLTPKPWRCGMRSKPPRWPWLDAKQEKLFRSWEAQYQSYSANWATCQFIRQVGNPVVHANVEPILKLHDSAARADSNLQLA